MIAVTASIEFVTTATETEALLLEANLIKRLRPRFNVLLRDDKSFPYILITADHWAPQILKHRGGGSRDGNYYGPVPSGLAGNPNTTAPPRRRGSCCPVVPMGFSRAPARPSWPSRTNGAPGPARARSTSRNTASW